MIKNSAIAGIWVGIVLVLLGCGGVVANQALETKRLDELQFFGSHNSYKRPIPPAVMAQLEQVNPELAAGLEYWHEPLADQLDLGVRVFEFDVFFDPTQQLFKRHSAFPVLHIQTIDTASLCATLEQCFEQLLAWTAKHPRHEPILVSFNAKDARIDRPGFVVPAAFSEQAFVQLDERLTQLLGERALTPTEVLRAGAPDRPVQWPVLSEARGKFLLLLDESGEKRDRYLAANATPVMFANLPATDPRAAIMVLNDPIGQADEICVLSRAGYLVRTRADADTVEARANSTLRRDAAFNSGAVFVSTDYYLPARHFNSDYQVTLPGGGAVRFNPGRNRLGCR